MKSDQTWSGREPLPDGIKVTLEVIEGPDQGVVYQLPYSKIIIGRKKGDLILTDREISGIHASIEVGRGRYILKDLGSTNGTLLEGRRITIASIRDGSEIKLGADTLRIEISEAALGEDEPEREMEREEIAVKEESFQIKKERFDDYSPPRTAAILLLMEKGKFGKIIELKRTRNVIGPTGESLIDVPSKGDYLLIEKLPGNAYQLRNPSGNFELLLNGSNVLSKELKEGDEIVLGPLKMKFLCGEDALKKARELSR